MRGSVAKRRKPKLAIRAPIDQPKAKLGGTYGIVARDWFTTTDATYQLFA
jgi:hypothetical protein